MMLWELWQSRLSVELLSPPPSWPPGVVLIPCMSRSAIVVSPPPLMRSVPGFRWSGAENDALGAVAEQAQRGVVVAAAVVAAGGRAHPLHVEKRHRRVTSFPLSI